jgi:asparagine synthase (glutamine-hydrolysing)
MRERPLPHDLIGRHREVSRALSHRGPDRNGEFVSLDQTCALFVNQWNITSFDDNEQPVSSERHEITSVLNGEVYNYENLNVRLKKSGVIIRTSCDTETLNKLFLREGESCFQEIDGIFGVAFYERERRRLVLARDRFGQVPLFYCEEDGRIHFASESNHLIQFTRREVDRDALLQYFAFGFSFDHMIAGIKRLPPATYAIADRSGVRQVKFWKPTFFVKPDVTESQAIKRAIEALEGAVGDLKPRKVHFGVFISGGIDSAIIAKLAERHSSHLPLFTSGLDGYHPSGVVPVDEDYAPVEASGNELSFADRLADSFGAKSPSSLGFDKRTFAAMLSGSPHHPLYMPRRFTVSDLMRDLPKMVSHLPGGPVMSTSFPPFYFSALTSGEAGIRVCFTGEGADELHGGYETCQPEFYTSSSLTERFLKLSNFFSADEMRPLLGEDAGDRLRDICATIDHQVESELQSDGGMEDRTFNRIRHFMFTYVFAAHLLEKGNGMVMCAGPTELRMPFLSNRYVEFIFSLRASLIRTPDQRKRLLAKVAEKVGVPEHIIRRPKQRTSLPYYGLFYNTPSFSETEHSVLNRESRLKEFINVRDPWEYIAGLRGTRDAHKRAWMLLILELWLRQFL